jgi:hypothetical protein
MSVRERRNRKDRRAKTPEQLRRALRDVYEPGQWPAGRTAVQALQDQQRGWQR